MTRSPQFKRLLLATALSASLGGCFPLRQGSFSPPTAAEVGPVLDNYGEAVVPAHGLIVAQGDDLIYGADPKSRRPGANGSDVHRTKTTITETLRRTLRPVKIVNRGYPNDTAAMGAERWAGEPVGNLVILSYGYGDAFAHTPPQQYHRALRDMVRQAHAQGAAVFLIVTPPMTVPSAASVVSNPALLPPPGRSGRQRALADAVAITQTSDTAPTPSTEPALALNASLESYRAETRKVGAEEGAEVFEPQAQLTLFKLSAASTVAQTPALYQLIAGGVAPYIKVVRDPASGRPSRRSGKPDRAQP